MASFFPLRPLCLPKVAVLHVDGPSLTRYAWNAVWSLASCAGDTAKIEYDVDRPVRLKGRESGKYRMGIRGETTDVKGQCREGTSTEQSVHDTGLSGQVQVNRVLLVPNLAFHKVALVVLAKNGFAFLSQMP